MHTGAVVRVGYEIFHRGSFDHIPHFPLYRKGACGVVDQQVQVGADRFEPVFRIDQHTGRFGQHEGFRQSVIEPFAHEIVGCRIDQAHGDRRILFGDVDQSLVAHFLLDGRIVRLVVAEQRFYGVGRDDLYLFHRVSAEVAAGATHQ